MKKLLFFLALLMPGIAACPQDISGRTSLSNDVVYEKVYLHADREFYAPRETIWFRVYLLSGITNRPIIGTKNVYVHLVNEAGKVVHERLLLSFDGVAAGDIEIPYDTPEGSYTIRAFTRYLENYGEESFFLKKIWISSMKQLRLEGGKIEDGAFDLSFYPESGHLVYNATNTVAFKAIDTLGRGIAISGSIVDDLGNLITPFQSEYLGMGSFVIMPQKGRQYFARVEEYPDYNYLFDDIRANGVAMNIKANSIEINIALSRDFSLINPEDFVIEASSKGVLLFREEVQMSSYNKELSISKSRFPLGIAKISLKKPSGQLVAERIIFVDAGFPDLIDVKTDKEIYGPRDSVSVELSPFFEFFDSIASGLSVAVINRDYLSRDGYNNDIRSYLLLDSELKGAREAPASYFSNDGGISPGEKLNLLMMVQGWRSYYWPDIILNVPDELDGWEDIGLSVSGTVKRLFRDQVLAGTMVQIGPFSSAFSFRDTLTNEKGRFRFDYLYLRDSSRLIINAYTPRGGRNTEILLDPMYMPDTAAGISVIDSITLQPEVPYTFYSESFSKLEAERKYAIESGTYWLEEVEIVKEAPVSFGAFMKPEVDRMYGTPDKSIKILDEYSVYFNVFDYLESNPVAGVVFSGEQISIRGGQEPLYMMDGIVVDKDMIETTPMGDIETLDIIKSGAGMAGMGSRGGDGIIAIYTKVGAYSTFERYVKGRAVKKVQGFHWPNEFYSPRYTLSNKDNLKPDFRPTLYWNPMLEVNKQKQTFDFYTSDFLSDYAIIVEGVSSDGEILTGYKEFSVRR